MPVSDALVKLEREWGIAPSRPTLVTWVRDNKLGKKQGTLGWYVYWSKLEQYMKDTQE